MTRRLFIGLFLLGSLIWTTAAYAGIGGDYQIDVVDVPALSVTYSDDNSRTPDELNRTYELTAVRNASVLFRYSVDVLLNSSAGQAADCTDPDINYLVRLEMGTTSSASIVADHETWDAATGTWIHGQTEVFDTQDHELALEPYTVTVSVCGSDGSVTPESDPTPSPDPDPTPTSDPTPSPDPDPTPTSDPTPSPDPDPTPTSDPTPSPDPDPTPTVRAITLQASETSVTRGATVVFSGEVSGPAGCVENQAVTLMSSSGASSKSQKLGTAVTELDGGWEIVLKVTKTRQYRAESASHGSCASVQSSPVVVEVAS